MLETGSKTLMIVPSLSGGGAERVAVLLARGWAERGYRVVLATIYGRDRDFYELPAQVERIALDLGRDRSNLAQKLTGNLKRILALRRLIHRTRPDRIVSFMNQTNVAVLLAAARQPVPVIVTEHMDPRRDDLPAAWRWLRRKTYLRATRLVSVSRAVDSFFDWLPSDRRAVIPNPLPLEEIGSQTGEPLAVPWKRTAIAMGRLSPEKGFDLLMRAFAAVAAEFCDWGLVILGEGPQRRELESLAQELRIGHRCALPGMLRHPFAALKQADLFVLSSRHEGFGNALVEAMACGLPVVASDCWSVSPEIARHEVDGILVPCGDAGALATALARMMRSESLRRQLGRAAVASAERFRLPVVIEQWQRLLDQISSELHRS